MYWHLNHFPKEKEIAYMVYKVLYLKVHTVRAKDLKLRRQIIYVQYF